MTTLMTDDITRVIRLGPCRNCQGEGYDVERGDYCELCLEMEICPQCLKSDELAHWNDAASGLGYYNCMNCGWRSQ